MDTDVWHSADYERVTGEGIDGIMTEMNGESRACTDNMLNSMAQLHQANAARLIGATLTCRDISGANSSVRHAVETYLAANGTEFTLRANGYRNSSSAWTEDAGNRGNKSRSLPWHTASGNRSQVHKTVQTEHVAIIPELVRRLSQGTIIALVLLGVGAAINIYTSGSSKTPSTDLVASSDDLTAGKPLTDVPSSPLSDPRQSCSVVQDTQVATQKTILAYDAAKAMGITNLAPEKIEVDKISSAFSTQPYDNERISLCLDRQTFLAILKMENLNWGK